jgi:hypothetical protein
MDPPISEASSGVKRPLSPEMSSNTTKRAKLELPPEQLTIINDGMISTSNVFKQVVDVDDLQALKRVSSYILAHLVQLLSTTSAKASTFQPLTAQQAQGVIDGFNDHELDEWKAGLQKGFQDNDWSGLIAHRTSQFAFKRRVCYNRRDSETSRCYDQDQEPASGGTYRAP